MKFLERHNLPKFTQREIDHLNRFLLIKEVKAIMNSLPKQKASGLVGCAGDIYNLREKKTNSLQSVPEYRIRGNTSEFIL